MQRKTSGKRVSYCAAKNVLYVIHHGEEAMW